MPGALSHLPDLDAYFSRIGYAGMRTPCFETLAAIHRRHVRAIPFENLDIHLGRGIRIDLPSVERKLVHDRRGGYCFEQNALFAAVLGALGFEVAPLMARVRWQLPAEPLTPLTHMLLRVETPDAGACIADVGFGSMSLIQPLRLELDREQAGGLEPRRIVRREPSEASTQGGDRIFVQQAKLGESWNDLYLFSTDEAPAVDFEVGNWFTSTHPQSRFKLNLIASRAAEGCRHTLLNRELATRHADGRVDKRSVESPEELLTVLAEYFDLHFAPGTRFGLPGAAWPV